MRHSKISGLANTAANKVGGADWDAGHVYDIGDMFPIGTMHLEVSTSSYVSFRYQLGNFNNDFAVSGNTITISSLRDYELVPGGEVHVSGTLSVVGKTGAVPSTFAVALSVTWNGLVTLQFPNGLPSAGVMAVYVSLFGRVLS